MEAGGQGRRRPAIPRRAGGSAGARAPPLRLHAAGAGIEAKKRNKSDVQIRKKNISKDLSRLSKLYGSGAITKKEFQKAKNKVLKN